MKKEAGVLLPVSSLPGRYGVGDFGKCAFEFIDIIGSMGFSYWQILPLNPLGVGNSPYQPYSSFAIDEIYIDLDTLAQEGYLKNLPEAIKDNDRCDYGNARQLKNEYLKKAFAQEEKKKIKSFSNKNKRLREYSLYLCLKNLYGKSWGEFEEGYEKGYKQINEDCPLYEEYLFYLFCQMVLQQQWLKIKEYANGKGIKIIGDMPFYVGLDSSDVWANQKCFLLEKDHKPAWIAGVPPDYFSKTGQRWGNPIYDFPYLEKHDFAFLKERLTYAHRLYDVIRIDHFRAFDTYWKIPSSCPTAIDGEWAEAPGYAFFDSLFKEQPSLKDSIIAEDLGLLRKQVYDLRDCYGFPGMDVIQFTFEGDELGGKGDFRKENIITYLGTHDNDTALSFFYNIDEIMQARYIEKLSQYGFFKGTAVDRLTRFALSKPSKLVILTYQDICSLDGECRLNTPGTVSEANWSFKLKDFGLLASNKDRIKEMIIEAGRNND